VRSWVLWQLETKRLSPATVNTAIATSCFCCSKTTRGHVEHPLRPEAPSVYDVLSVTDVERLLAVTTNNKHRVMFALL
jgi:hypothetical protein